MRFDFDDKVSWENFGGWRRGEIFEENSVKLRKRLKI